MRVDVKVKALIGLAILAALAITWVFLGAAYPVKLSGQFSMTRILGGVLVEGLVKNSGMFPAKNVTIHFEFYDDQGNILRITNWSIGDIGPFGERSVTLRFRVQARDFSWSFAGVEG